MRVAVCLLIAVATGCHGAKFGRLSGVRDKAAAPADGSATPRDACAPTGPPGDSRVGAVTAAGSPRTRSM